MDKAKNTNTKVSSNHKDKADYGTLTDVPSSKVDGDKLNQSLVP